jgi:hypothetical protein
MTRKITNAVATSQAGLGAKDQPGRTLPDDGGGGFKACERIFKIEFSKGTFTLYA